MTSPFAAAFMAFVIAIIGTPLLRAFGMRFAVLDVPNERSSHLTPTPRHGGIAILAGFAVAAIASGGLVDHGLFAALLCTVLIAVLGGLDDVKHFRAAPKFVVHIAAAVASALIGRVVLQSVELPFAGPIALGLLAIPLTVIWIVGLINAYNFMDGANGIAALQAVVAAGALALLAWRAGDAPAALVTAALAGASAGFLPWNFPRGTIFMGDVGSASIGFLFGVLVLRAAHHAGIIAAALPLFPFLFDSSVTVFRRALRGERFFSTPHRSHFYQRLMKLTGSHVVVSLTWAALAVVCSVIALLYGALGAWQRVASLALVGALHVGLALLITYREMQERRGRETLLARPEP